MNQLEKIAVKEVNKCAQQTFMDLSLMSDNLHDIQMFITALVNGESCETDAVESGKLYSNILRILENVQEQNGESLKWLNALLEGVE